MACRAHGGGVILCGAMSLAGRPDAAYRDSSREGRRRLGYVIGLMSPSPSGPCHILQRTSKFTRRLVKSSLGGRVYALSEMVGDITLLREFYPPFLDISPGMVGMETWESPFTHLKTKMVTEEYLVRHLLGF